MRAEPIHHPITAASFASWLDALGPFESQPHLAVGLSGGVDSSALMALTQEWAAARGDVTLTALIVDHGLRPSSADEARRTAEYWCGRGINAVILTNPNQAPTRAIEETARADRWALLEGWCQQHGVFHLLLGHHRDDQAETVLMRLAKASGPVGLSGMARHSHRGQLRVLRPLLSARRAELAATVEARGLTVVEDPSNADPRYLRNRMRAATPILQEIGLTTAALCDLAEAQAAIAQTLDRQINQLAIRCLSVDALGVVTLDYGRAIAVRDHALLAMFLGRILSSVGGHRYPVRRALQDHAARWLAEPFESIKPITLGGCRMAVKQQDGRQYVTVMREVSGAQAHEAQPIRAGDTLIWDGRFRLTIRADHPGEGSVIGPADQAVWSALKPVLPRELSDLPAQCRWALPALHDDARPIAVLAPGHLDAQSAARAVSICWAPLLPMLRVT